MFTILPQVLRPLAVIAVTVIVGKIRRRVFGDSETDFPIV